MQQNLIKQFFEWILGIDPSNLCHRISPLQHQIKSKHHSWNVEEKRRKVNEKVLLTVQIVSLPTDTTVIE